MPLINSKSRWNSFITGKSRSFWYSARRMILGMAKQLTGMSHKTTSQNAIDFPAHATREREFGCIVPPVIKPDGR